MQPQQQRDAKTLVIATGLGLFVLVVALGCAVLWLATSVLDLSEETVSTGFWFVSAVAAAAWVWLVRSQGRR
ncbi:hypothetical protein DDE18_22340 [Nocardioides gansuensis]|uniref:Uncharacterized protein n=1 Tax=Nocardioides gansuensis TaxID=2138300 RepID=A0A2T8F4G4_9ACTN|nr:hypothetical protein [Nocardioides gansuensis]PVG80601.1 hypothetical protein DDE18_22340 [Nocardioides gansuensis]